jgi:hypothetical protein
MTMADDQLVGNFYARRAKLLLGSSIAWSDDQAAFLRHVAHDKPFMGPEKLGRLKMLEKLAKMREKLAKPPQPGNAS